MAKEGRVGKEGASKLRAGKAHSRVCVRLCAKIKMICMNKHKLIMEIEDQGV